MHHQLSQAHADCLSGADDKQKVYLLACWLSGTLALRKSRTEGHSRKLCGWSAIRSLLVSSISLADFNQRGYFEEHSKRVVNKKSPKPLQKHTPPSVVSLPLVKESMDQNQAQENETSKPVPDPTGEQPAEEFHPEAETQTVQMPVAATFIPERVGRNSRMYNK